MILVKTNHPYLRVRRHNYKTLWQRFWMCDNLTYDAEPGDTEVRTNRLCCTI
jgi:hypothetical protein